MRTYILTLTLSALLPIAAAAAETKMLSFSGSVDVRTTRDGGWSPAAENMEIPEGGAVRTGAGGSAVVLMPNKTKVWLKESSSLEFDQRQTLSSRLALLYGKIKLRVPHLMRKEKFEVRTPAAVCAVRGTEFTMGTTEDGKFDLQVLFGEVKLKYNVPPAKGPDHFSIPQGQGISSADEGKANKPVLLTAAIERQALENWNPGLKPEERQKDIQQKENDRAQIKEFAAVTTSAEKSVKSFLNVVKESDLEAGRTMNDVHGNVVRVDQRMMRPDASTIQFFNIVKRPTYNASVHTTAEAALHGFDYNGGAVSDRLDLLQMNVGFNKDLPQRIEEWPSFFNGNDVKPSYMSTIMANRTNVGGVADIFFVATGAKYDAVADDMKNNPLALVGYSGSNVNSSYADNGIIITGVLKDETGVDAVQGLTKISKLEIVDANANGLLKYTGGSLAGTNVNGTNGSNVVWAQSVSGVNSSYKYSSDDAGSDQLWNYSADLFRIGGNGRTGDSTTNIWYTRESYVIGNAGNIRATTDFTSSSSDPFTILKENGGEVIAAIKPWQSGASAYAQIVQTTEKFATTKNIDIVFIPDLFLAAVQRMLPALSELGN